MIIRKHHLYLANLSPRYGTESGKTRPVVVVQTNLLNQAHTSTVVCPVTSKVVKEAAMLRVHIPKKDSGLKKDSDILVDQIRAIDNRRFVKELGRLNLKQSQQLSDNLGIILFE